MRGTLFNRLEFTLLTIGEEVNFTILTLCKPFIRLKLRKALTKNKFGLIKALQFLVHFLCCIVIVTGTLQARYSYRHQEFFMAWKASSNLLIIDLPINIWSRILYRIAAGEFLQFLKCQPQCSFKILLIKNSVIPIKGDSYYGSVLKRQPFWYLQINFNNYRYLQVRFTLMVKKIQINKSNYSNKKKTPEKIERVMVGDNET